MQYIFDGIYIAYRDIAFSFHGFVITKPLYLSTNTAITLSPLNPLTLVHKYHSELAPQIPLLDLLTHQMVFFALLFENASQNRCKLLLLLSASMQLKPVTLLL